MADSAYSNATVFAVDVGVYISGAEGIPLHGTTFAWAKRRLPLTAGVSGQEPLPVRTNWTADSHNIRVLVDMMVSAFESGQRVALGFEAPMWLPLFRLLPSQSFRLFQPRFEQERSREWYLQAGAAATTKGMSFAALLLSLLRERTKISQITTDRRRWMESPSTVLLFEAFVAGSFKLPTPPGADRDEWDAQTAAIAYALALMPSTESPFLSQTLVSADNDSSSALSIWAAAARSVGLDDAECRGRCDVVGLQPKPPE